MSTNHISYENIDDFIVMDSDNKPGGEIDKKASLILSMLDKDIQYLLNHLKHKYANKDHRVNILIKNYARDDLRENNKNTYVVGKGDKIYLCLRNNGKILEYNILMFVLLHELAHMVTPEYNHTPLFWNNNVWIMKEAESIRIFNNVDYSKSPVYYCNNMYIDVNPSFVESN
jgi:predicted metal-dependent hydrolase